MLKSAAVPVMSAVLVLSHGDLISNFDVKRSGCMSCWLQGTLLHASVAVNTLRLNLPSGANVLDSLLDSSSELRAVEEKPGLVFVQNIKAYGMLLM